MKTRNLPEENFARSIVRRHQLVPPFDIQEIISKYATVVFDDIPDVDGICLNIKVPGKTPTVIVNNNTNSTRQRFTMAHELGHIIIPWHIGTLIADKLEVPHAEYEAAHSYWELEGQANRFAAELLMPAKWVSEQIVKIEDLARLHEYITLQCGVSAWAAAIRLSALLPPHIVYCAENGSVQYSGRTDGTFANPLTKGDIFFEISTSTGYYSFNIAKYSWRSGGQDIHWWRLPSAIDSNTTEMRSWQEIQNDIIASIDYPGSTTALKHSLNGIIGSANSMYKRGVIEYNAEGLVAACMQRFHNRNELVKIVNHPDFKIFLQKRAIDIVNNYLSS